MRGEISFEMRCKFVANLIELDINLHLYCIKYEEWLTIYDAEYGPRLFILGSCEGGSFMHVYSRHLRVI